MSSKGSKQRKLHGAVAQNQNNPFRVFPQSFDFTNLRCKIFLSKNLYGLQQGIHLGKKVNGADGFERMGQNLDFLAKSSYILALH